MKKYIIITCIIICTFCLNCRNESIEYENYISIDLDNLINEYLPRLNIKSVIQLETNDSSLIGDISAIEYHNEKIYILDRFKSTSLFAFSDDGTLIGRTKIGKGPGEVVNPFAFFVEKNSGFVYLWDQALMSMLKFDTHLEYLSQEKFPNPLLDFALLENHRKIIFTHYSSDFCYKIIGSDNRTVEKSFVPDFEYGGAMALFRSISVNKRILFITPYQYHIFELENDEVHSAYYVDFGKYSLSKNFVKERGMQAAQDLVDTGEKVSSLNDISEGDSFISFRVYFNSEELSLVYSLVDENVYLINEYFGTNDLPVCSLRGIGEGDLFYSVVEPVDLDNFQKTTGNVLVDSGIDYNNNPYLVTFTIGD